MIAELLHAGLGWPIAIVLIGTSFLGSLITAGFGIGGGAVMLAVLATFVPPAAIVPVHGLVQLGSNAGRFFLFRKNVYTSMMTPFVLGSLAGIAVGGLSVVQLDAGALQIAVGLFILWTILFRPPALMRKSAAVTGALSSFLTMFFGGTGPFVAAYIKTLELDRITHVATHAACMTLQHLLKTIVFGLLGFAFSQWAGLIVLLIVSGFLGSVAGRHLLFRINERFFIRLLNTILTILALRLIYAGATDIWFQAD
ncbi:sulfite exporter TauE/SafE family protein [Roseobacter sp. YSTF-M11]|uniref:Probable membrane transporter protein n=1 Tax=Roseobacter insulae TaxID=2859783 RepID=A0A9X1K0I8_9RHOB|nr:sulfite exporter TauE/SafE family protein [Roseobacter insulae]MBW4708209.1 sulfite exporter TauE/SafE family protein [Roseobacter insulae]